MTYPRNITYKKATRERLVELLKRIGWQVQKASTDGSWQRIHLPDGTFSHYWIYGDNEPRIEQRLDDFRGGATFYLKDCIFECNGETLNVTGRDNKSIFLSFHNFKSHKEPADVA